MAEIQLNEHNFLVSQTDRQGVILFANDDFCNIAGYTVAELIGKPHNIVRHPDMPKAAFKDLWDTVQAGKVWTGFVKNFHKNRQDYYWVYATVYPNSDGFMSCRRMATREEIQEADALYQRMGRGA